MSSLKTTNPKFSVKTFPLNASKPGTLAPTGSSAANITRAQAKIKIAGNDDSRQRRLMIGSLCLLLLTLSIVLWHDRDFWFPDSPDADADQPVETTHVASAVPTPAAVPAPNSAAAATAAPKALHARANPPSKPTLPTTTPAPQNGVPVVASRTVLPPLQVEVVAGDSHRMVRPGNNSIRVDLQPGTAPQPAPEADAGTGNLTAAGITTNASERVRISADTSAAVASSVKPNYPLLARQMKVQGSVVLQALIGRDGVIQNLRVVSGPQILASAAEDAVRQWRFRPHYEGSEAVETQANITVNFTISTN
jgi:periplasmic protein TonB